MPVFAKTFTLGLDRAEKALYNVFAKRLNAESTESIVRERIAESEGKAEWLKMFKMFKLVICQRLKKVQKEQSSSFRLSFCRRSASVDALARMTLCRRLY